MISTDKNLWYLELGVDGQIKDYYKLKKDTGTKWFAEFNFPVLRMQKRPYSREERFHAMEKELLKPLKPEPYEMRLYADLKVQANCHVELIQEQLGDNFGYEWTSVAYQETKAGSTTVIIFAMALLVAFLVLSAQYESWTSPLAAIMGLPIALLGAIIGCWVMGVPVSVYTQIGIILLIALSAKNGILIVEFARDFRKEGNPIRDSALEAGHVRLRPILMTSFAFVLGVMPLLFATGAGAASRISLGAAVVFGMAINTIFATMFIPNFYELMQTIQEKWLDKGKKTDDTPKQ